MGWAGIGAENRAHEDLYWQAAAKDPVQNTLINEKK